MPEPYHYIRFRWWQHVDLNEVYKELKGEFKVEKKEMPREKGEIGLYMDKRNELLVADTVQAYLGKFRANLNQSEAKPFTSKDLKLREKVIELYPHNRPTPFPWSFSSEPMFKTE
jgi:hypothetical protein